MAKLMSNTKIMTNEVRFSYAHLSEPVSVNGGDPRYSASIIIPKSDQETYDIMQKAIENTVQVGIEKFGKGFKNAKTHYPIHDGDTEKPEDEAYANAWYVNVSNKTAPGIVDANRMPITNETDIYSGMYGRCTINFYPYSVSGSGISASLQNVQKLRDGEALGGVKASAVDDFGSPEDNDEFLN